MGADYYHFYYRMEGENTFWYDEENGQKMRFYHGNDYSAANFNLINGASYEVYVTAVKGGVESAGSKVFYFTKKQIAAQKILSYYSEYPSVPDFGEIYGVPRFGSKADEMGVLYLYKLDKNAVGFVTQYETLLSNLGFLYSRELSDEVSKQLKNSIVFKSAYGYMIVSEVQYTQEGALYLVLIRPL